VQYKIIKAWYWTSLFLVFILVFLGVASAQAVGERPGSGVRPDKKEVRAKFGGLSLPFIANQGQSDPEVLYYAPTFAGTVFVTKDGRLLYSLPPKREIAGRREKAQAQKEIKQGGWTLVESLLGGKPTPQATQRATTNVSFFLGNDPKAWRSEVPTYQAVSLGEVWPGVHVALKARGDNVEKLFTVAPGASVESFRLRLEGTNGLWLSDQGELVAETGLGEVTFSAPIAWQEKDGRRYPVEVAYHLKGQEYGFRLGVHDPTLALFIDPLIQATYLGGSSGDTGSALAIHPTTGDIYIAGGTTSTDFPGTAGGAQPTFGGPNFDAFVVKISDDTAVPLLSVNPSSLDFGPVVVGSSKDLDFTVQNTGGGTLFGSAATSAPFSIIGDNSFSLAANENKVITVRFSPTSAGIFNGNVNINSNGGNASVFAAGIGLVPASNPRPPRITSISPSSGVPGDTITVLGSNFGPTPGALSVGSTVVSPLTWNDTFIQFLLPDIAPRRYTLQLTTSTAARARGSVTVLPPPPRITRLLPASGAPGTTVLIDGFNFGDQQGSSTISIGGETPEIVSWANERIAIKVPALAPKGYPMQLTTIAGQAKAKFTVKPLLLLTEQGPCDDSFLGTLAGTCWVTVPIQTKQNSNGTVNISLQNIWARWYEVTVSGASFSGPNPFLIGPNQTITLNNPAIGPDGKISFYADGESTRAIDMHIWDFLYIMVTGERMPTARTDQISSYVFGLCGTISDICSFSSDLRDAFLSKSPTQIVSVLATLPIVLAGDEITEQSFLATFKFSASQVARIERWSTVLALLELAYHVVGVLAQQVYYLTAPSFATSCLLTPSNAGTCQ